jgi:hypothetical protein
MPVDKTSMPPSTVETYSFFFKSGGKLKRLHNFEVVPEAEMLYHFQTGEYIPLDPLKFDINRSSIRFFLWGSWLNFLVIGLFYGVGVWAALSLKGTLPMVFLVLYGIIGMDIINGIWSTIEKTERKFSVLSSIFAFLVFVAAAAAYFGGYADLVILSSAFLVVAAKFLTETWISSEGRILSDSSYRIYRVDLGGSSYLVLSKGKK